jgi:serine/threonine-protein phosphatase with EF-hands
LKEKQNINYISTKITNQITVVGDIHGQIDDLLTIFYKNGLPSETNPYLFNGDFVDRGPMSIEVSLILFCGLLANQSATYINRGNHEDYVMNARYGFIKEICSKYSSYSKRICNLYNEVFSYLPLASIIDNRIYVVHGGISDRTTIDSIAKINRSKYVSILKPPILNDEGNLVTSNEMKELYEWRQVLDALWSDPKLAKGIEANSFRGGGCLFGPDITELVMKKNNFDLIIRSHECKESGFDYQHDGKVLTIFSASNYYETGSNNGAYVKISPHVKPHIIQFTVKQEDGFSQDLTLREKVNKIEVTALNHLVDKFMANKNRLLDAYALKDTKKEGVLSINDWCQITGTVLDLKTLPWRLLRPKLTAKLDKNGNVLYKSTFEGKMMTLKNRVPVDNNITESLYRHKDMLEAIFRSIDKDHSGNVN